MNKIRLITAVLISLTLILPSCRPELSVLENKELEPGLITETSSPIPTVQTSSATQTIVPEVLLSDEEAAQILEIILLGDQAAVRKAVEKVLLAGDKRFISVFIELLRAVEVNIHPADNYKLYATALVQLSGQDFQNNFSSYFEWYGGTSLTPPPGFTNWKGQLLSGLDYRFLQFFQNDLPSEIRVEEILWGGVYLDGIPPLDHSPLLNAAEQNYLEDEDLVFGIAINGETRAYPLKIMDWHEMANDTIGDIPVALAYCTLCGSGIAFQAQLPDGTELNFSSSGFLYRSNKLMYDRQTNTLWNQLTGRPVLGPLAGKGIQLKILPLVLTDWKSWKNDHPNTLVLDDQTGFERTYKNGAAYGDYFSSDSVMFPVWRRSNQLEDKTYIYALQIEGIQKAYPVQLLVEEMVVNDQIAETNLVITALNGSNEVLGQSFRIGPVNYSSGAEIRVFERMEHSFTFSGSQNQLTDENGAIWDINEEGLSGPNGELLKRINGHLSYWFGWFAFFPQTLVYPE